MLRSLSPKMRIALGIAIIALVTIMAVLYAPPEGESNNVSGDQPLITPTVAVIQPQSSQEIQRQIEFQGMHLTIKNAAVAQKFSDDRKRIGKYTLRVQVDAINKSQKVIGVEYSSLVYLIIPDKEPIATKLISIKAVAMPDQLQSGFFDFPLDQPVNLDDARLEFRGGPTVPLQKA